MDGNTGNFISLRPEIVGEETGMGVMDVLVILSLVERFTNLDLDIVAISTSLLEHGLPQAQQYRIIHRYPALIGAGSDAFRSFLRQIAGYVTFNNFISVLRTAECFQFADTLLLERFGEPTLCMAASEIPNSAMMNRFYSSVKSLINSGRFPNRRTALINISIYLRNEASTTINPQTSQDARERSIRLRQNAFDKLAIAACLRVNCYKNRKEKLEVLEDLMRAVPEGLEKQSAEIIVCIGRCMTEKTSGDTEAAKARLEDAKRLNTVACNNFLKFLIWHTQHLLFRTMFVRDPTRENLDEAMRACHLGMGCAILETEMVRMSWTTTFMVFSAMLFLRIGQEFEIIPGTEPDKKHRQEAEEIINAANRGSRSWDSRREMMYQCCMARIHEGTERNLAIEECERAGSLAEEGAYTVNEKRNLTAYYTMLQC